MPFLLGLDANLIGTEKCFVHDANFFVVISVYFMVILILTLCLKIIASQPTAQGNMQSVFEFCH